MLLRWSLGLPAEADRLEKAVARVLEQGYRTADIVQPGCTRVTTAEMGSRVLEALDATI
jgi:3-isopropylmalate dehydrogenase